LSKDIFNQGLQLYEDDYIQQAHKLTMCNEAILQKSSHILCLYCGETYTPKEGDLSSLRFFEEHNGQKTYQCSICLCDCLLGNASGYPIDDPIFQARFTRYWFNGYSRLDQKLSGL